MIKDYKLYLGDNVEVMRKEIKAEWIVKAIETIKSGIADKLEKDDVKE